MIKRILTLLLIGISGTSFAQETFTMKDGDSTVTMQKYFICFLKKGTNRTQDSASAAQIQKDHLAHITQMANDGFASIAGPFAEDGDTRGIIIFNTKTKEEAEKLANEDPAVKAGRLKVEMAGWWAQKGTCLK